MNRCRKAAHLACNDHCDYSTELLSWLSQSASALCSQSLHCSYLNKIMLTVIPPLLFPDASLSETALDHLGLRCASEDAAKAGHLNLKCFLFGGGKRKQAVVFSTARLKLFWTAFVWYSF